MSGPLTGPNAEYGQIWKKAFDIAVEEINAKGGIKGRKVQILFEDTQSDPKQSVVGRREVRQRQADRRRDRRLRVAGLDGGLADLRAGGPGPVRLHQLPSGLHQGRQLHVLDRPEPDGRRAVPGRTSRSRSSARRSWCCSTRTRTGARPRPTSSRRKAKELGAQIVYRDAYLPDEKDFKTIVTKARDANPDGLALMSYYTDAALIAQQARGQGLNVDIIANGATYSPKFIELGGAAVEGVDTTSPWFSGNPRPAVQEFVKKYKDAATTRSRTGSPATPTTPIMILANVIEKVGTDRKAIRDGLAGLKDYPSLVYGTPELQRRAPGRDQGVQPARRSRAASSSSGRQQLAGASPNPPGEEREPARAAPAGGGSEGGLREQARTCRRGADGATVDRPPVSTWRHFVDREQNATDLAAAMLDYHRDVRLGLDEGQPPGDLLRRGLGQHLRLRALHLGRADGRPR